jgi:hypothetical protein
VPTSSTRCLKMKKWSRLHGGGGGRRAGFAGRCKRGDTFVFVVGVEIGVELKEALECGMLDGLIDGDEILQILTESAHPSLQKHAVLVVEEAFRRECRETSCRCRINLCTQLRLDELSTRWCRL